MSRSVNGSYELPFGPQKRFLNNASAPVNFAGSMDGLPAPSSTCRPVSRSRRSSATTPPATATRATRCGPTGTRPSAAIYIRARPASTSTHAAFLPPATGTYGNVSRDALTGPGLYGARFLGVQERAHHRASWLAVPRRVLQHPQPHQFPHAQRSGLHFGDLWHLAHGRSGHSHIHDLASNSVRRQVAVLKGPHAPVAGLHLRTGRDAAPLIQAALPRQGLQNFSQNLFVAQLSSKYFPSSKSFP